MSQALLRCVLIEDEWLASERLHRLLLQTDDYIEVVAQLGSVAQARRWFAQGKPVDLIFADVQLADGLCFEIFGPNRPPAPLVLTTSYEADTLSAFMSSRSAYLRKPIKRSELQATMSQIRANQFNTSALPFINRIKTLLAKLR